ncbi:MAG: methylase [Herminiimonas sp.]|nr:methylase [Herminiimonas sp.]
MYDPTAGTGGMLSIGEQTMAQLNPSARLRMFGQELNPESYAICKADMLIKGQDPARIKRGNTLSDDKFPNEKFDYMLSNPPFGVDWKKAQYVVKSEHEKKGFAGRFGPGLPRISDGSLLFLMHLVSKMRPSSEGGSRIGIVLNGSPLFTGDAGSGESEIRRWLLENDMLETIIALPNDLFYNTGIATYVWILDNAKAGARKGKVQLIDATRMYGKKQKSLGSKRVEITDPQITEIVATYAGFKEETSFENEFKERLKQGVAAEVEPARIVSKIFRTTFFGYRKVTIDRPPAAGTTVKFKKGEKPFDKDLRDTESIPMVESIVDYVKREVLPHVPDAWVNKGITDEKDGQVGKVGYEINFNRYFYVYKAPRPPHVIAGDIREMEKRFLGLMKGVVA